MKRILALLLVFAMFFSLSACEQKTDGMVSQDKYDALQKKYDELKEDYDAEVAYNDKLVDELAKMKADYTLLEIELGKYKDKPSKSDSTPASTEAENKAEDKYGLGVPSYDEAQYKVGKDIPAGEYVLLANGKLSSGYFFVTRDANGDDKIFSDSFESASIITVYDGEYLEIVSCIAIPAEEWYAKYIVNIDKTGITLKIGYDIPAGEYRLISDNDKTGYYFVYGSSRYEKALASNSFEKSSYVTVEEGQYLKLAYCYIDQE